MIKHVVCFKLKDLSDAPKAREILLSMKGKVPQITDIEVGLDYLHSERSYDVILTVTVKDETALNEYLKDEYHCSVVKPFMHAVRVSSVAVDYYV